jgi:hypothetical protein
MSKQVITGFDKGGTSLSVVALMSAAGTIIGLVDAIDAMGSAEVPIERAMRDHGLEIHREQKGALPQKERRRRNKFAAAQQRRAFARFTTGHAGRVYRR